MKDDLPAYVRLDIPGEPFRVGGAASVGAVQGPPSGTAEAIAAMVAFERSKGEPLRTWDPEKDRQENPRGKAVWYGTRGSWFVDPSMT